MYISHEHYEDIARSAAELFVKYIAMKIMELDSEDEEQMEWLAARANEFADGVVPVVLNKVGYKGIEKISWIDFVKGASYED